MHARYFASVQGRFSGADSFGGSIGNPQSLNRYAYVVNNPINLSDPTGHEGRYNAHGVTYWLNQHEGSLILGAQWEIDAAIADYADRTGNWVEPDAETSKGDEDGGAEGKAAAGGAPQNSSQPQQQQRPTCDPGFFDQNQNFTISGDPNNRSFTGSDLNFAARVVFAESSSLTSGRGDEINRERSAIASVLYNRIGAVGFPDRRARTTFEGVAEAPGAFASIGGAKLNSSAPGHYQNLQEAVVNSRGQVYGGDCNDLRSSVDSIRRLVNFGAQYGYTQFRSAATRGQGTVIGGNRFW